MSRDAGPVLVIVLVSLAGTAVLGVSAWRSAGRLRSTLAEVARQARTDPLLYADAARSRADPPARFAARLPRVQEFESRATEAFPPPAHVRDLLCAGDPDMWRRLREAILASREVTARQVAETYGKELEYCPGDGRFALELVARGDPAPVALPAWVALARCPGPEADAAFTRADAPAVALLQRASRAHWAGLEGRGGVRAPPPERVIPAAIEVFREGGRLERREAAFTLGQSGPKGVEALLSLHAKEGDPKLRHDLAMALSESDDPRARAIVEAACRKAEDPACARREPAGLPAPTQIAAEGPSPALVARLRALKLLPEGAQLEGSTAGDLLVSAGRAHCFDTETGQFPNEHDSLLRSLAALAGDGLKGAMFEEIPLGGPDDDESPYRLLAYLGGERFEVRARNLGDWYDVEATIGLLNAVARARGVDVRWLVLESGDQTATVVAGPEGALRIAVAEKLLRVGGADQAMDAGKSFEEEVMRKLNGNPGAE